jgi:uncharacterized protein YkwD
MPSRRLQLAVALALALGVAPLEGAPAQQNVPAPLPVVTLTPPVPMVGQAATLDVTVQDPGAAIAGLRLDLGEPGGRSGRSACDLGAPPPGSPFAFNAKVTFHVDFRFRVAGHHDISFIVTSGGCAGPRRTFSGHLTVDVPLTPSFVPPPGVTRAGAAAAGCSSADTVPTQNNLAAMRAATLCLINIERRQRGLRALRANAKLAKAAERHTSDMVHRRFFDHQGPRGPSFAARIHRVGYNGSAGEDIGYETASPDATPRSTVKAWMNSSGHRANILRKAFRAAGVGVSSSAPIRPPQRGATFTVDFGSAP